MNLYIMNTNACISLCVCALCNFVNAKIVGLIIVMLKALCLYVGGVTTRTCYFDKAVGLN